MAARTTPVLACLLAGMASALAAPPPVPVSGNLRLRLVWGGSRQEIPPGEAGLEVAAGILEVAQGAGFRAGSVWSVLLALHQDPQLQAAVAHAAALAGPRRIVVELHAADSRDGLLPGHPLVVPGGARRRAHRLLAGESLEELARRWGTSVEAIVVANEASIEVDAYEEKEDDGTSMVRMGETGMAHEDPASRRATFVHEVGHASDPELCEDDYGYGLDDQHEGEEVLSPAMAFQEGWPNYLGAHVSGSDLAREATSPVGTLVIDVAEGRPPPAWAARVEDGHAVIPAALLRGRHLLANEQWVSAIALRLEGLAPGRGPLDRAYRATAATPCRHVGTLLARYLEQNPGQRDATREALARLLRVDGRALLRGAELEELLRGRLPQGMQGGDAPRVEGAVQVLEAPRSPGTGPAAAPAAQPGPFGL